jgi:predicted transcriptional regulator
MDTMKKLPDGELELMMIIWEAGEPVSRIEIEEKMDTDKLLTAGTILSYLSRLEEKGFVEREKRGKMNYYRPLVEKKLYLKETGKTILKKMFGGSLSNFATALYDGEELSSQDIEELRQFLDSKKRDDAL